MVLVWAVMGVSLSKKSSLVAYKGIIVAVVILVAILVAELVLVFNRPTSSAPVPKASASAGKDQPGAKADSAQRDQALFRLPYRGDPYSLNERACPQGSNRNEQIPFESLANPAITRWTAGPSGIKTPHSFVGAGPNKVNDAGMPICYERSYKGAALAAANIFPFMLLNNGLRPAATYLYQGELAHSKLSPEDLQEYTKGFQDWYKKAIVDISEGQERQIKDSEVLGYLDEHLETTSKYNIHYESIRVGAHRPNALSRQSSVIVKADLTFNISDINTTIWLIWNDVKQDWFVVCADGRSASWASKSPACTPLKKGSYTGDMFEVNLD